MLSYVLNQNCIDDRHGEFSDLNSPRSNDLINPSDYSHQLLTYNRSTLREAVLSSLSRCELTRSGEHNVLECATRIQREALRLIAACHQLQTPSIGNDFKGNKFIGNSFIGNDFFEDDSNCLPAHHPRKRLCLSLSNVWRKHLSATAQPRLSQTNAIISGIGDCGSRPLIIYENMASLIVPFSRLWEIWDATLDIEFDRIWQRCRSNKEFEPSIKNLSSHLTISPEWTLCICSRLLDAQNWIISDGNGDVQKIQSKCLVPPIIELHRLLSCHFCPGTVQSCDEKWALEALSDILVNECSTNPSGDGQRVRSQDEDPYRSEREWTGTKKDGRWTDQIMIRRLINQLLGGPKFNISQTLNSLTRIVDSSLYLPPGRD